MRTLFLLRHAKSSWHDPTLADHDRPLAPRGVRAARRMADHLTSEAVRPELVLCSSARRTRETLDLLLPAFGDHVDVRVEDSLYGADADALLDRLRHVADDVASVLLVGHNPAVHDLAVDLTGGGQHDALDQLRAKFPTGALATLGLGRAGWSDLGPGRAYLAGLVVPRELPQEPVEG